jgi:hypothetical protein
LRQIFLVHGQDAAERPAPIDPDVVHVDREREIGIFTRMIAGQGSEHIIFITAPSGMGKTRLMEEFDKRARVHAEARVAMIRLDAGVVDAVDVLIRLQAAIDRGGDFPNFDARHLEIANASGLSAQAERAQLQWLTKAFVTDLVTVSESAAGPTVLIFDAYNNHQGLVEGWLESNLLNSVTGRRSVNVVVSGHVAPRHSVEGRTTRSEVGRLELAHAIEWSRRLQLNLSPEVVQAFYVVSDGLPRALRDTFYKYQMGMSSDG